MNHRQLLPTLASGAVRKSFELSYDVEAEPEAVFPLLCPVREYEWLDGWACEMVYSHSGFAEPGCVFRTLFGEVPEVWHVNAYDPPRRIEYLVVAPDMLITRLTIELAPSGEA